MTANTTESAPIYEPVTTNIDQDLIMDGMRAYLNYINLPLDERRRLHYFDRTKARLSQAGYELKDHAAQDNKHVFHMSQDLAVNIEPNMRSFPTETKDFFTTAKAIQHELNVASKAILEQWAKQENIPALRHLHLPDFGIHENHTRFVAYRGGRNGILASGHYDKSTATIAVAESHNGLRVGVGPDDLALLARQDFEPIVFPGYGWHQFAENKHVIPRRRAAWHDVIDTGEQVSPEVARWALIHFINPLQYFESTTEQTHTPIPWQQNLGGLAIRTDQKSFLTT